MSSDDLRKLLKRGNPQPAPGPDDWEKWALANSGDEWLKVVASLVNYLISRNYFPPALKENFIVPLWKKGDTLDPNNYRGIVLANTVQIVATSWYNYHLMRYIWQHKMIPDTQIAAQLGARVGDMTHLLNALDGFAKQSKITAYALKRDQKKGFDYLHQMAFVDAVFFFGLPASVLEFDQARTAGVSLRVKCRGMLSEPLLTDGLTKQGDPFSPMKYVLSMAMAQWWLHDRFGNIGLCLQTPLRVSGLKSKNGEKPHTDADYMEMYINLVMAMDDTILIAVTTGDLQELTFAVESFQGAYNMVTEWEKPDKTTIFLLGVDDPAPSTSQASITDPQVDTSSEAHASGANRETPAQIGGQVTLQLPEGRNVTLRITQDRRFLKTPINDPRTQGQEILDIVRAFHFPKPGRNLPITALRFIAQVSLAGKILPRLQAHPMADSMTKDISRILNVKIQRYYNHPFPASPEILTAPIREGGLEFPNIRKLNAVWSIAALHRCLNSHNDTFRIAFQIMHATFQCFGKASHRCYLPFAPPVVTYGSWNGPKKNRFVAWEVTRQYMIDLGLQFVPANRIDASDARIHQTRSDHTAKFAAAYCLDDTTENMLIDIVDSLEDLEVDNMAIHWATDGSSDVVEPLQPRRTALAVVGPVDFAIRLEDRFATIQDAEVAAIASAIRMDLRLRERFGIPDEIKTKIYSDHLNTVRRIEDRASSGSLGVQPHTPSRHALRWLEAMLSDNPNVELVHQKAHTDEQAGPALLNARADEKAKQARDSEQSLRIPVDFSDDFAIYHPDFGFSHGHTPTLVRTLWEKKNAIPFDEANNVYKYQEVRLFTKAKSASSAKTALLTRSNQLPTEARKIRSNLDSPVATCPLCDVPAAQANDEHIFVKCAAAEPTLQKQYEAAGNQIESYSQDCEEWTESDEESHYKLLEALFFDDPLWGGTGKTKYWKGALPKNFEYNPKHSALYDSLCGICTRTAAIIWGKHAAKLY